MNRIFLWSGLVMIALIAGVMAREPIMMALHRHALLSVQGVTEAKRLLRYEGRNISTVELESGLEISISGYELLNMQSTENLSIERIGGYALRCVNAEKPFFFVAFGIRVRDVLRGTPEIRVDSMNEVMKSAPRIFEYMRSTFPEGQEQGKVIDTGGFRYTCVFRLESTANFE